MIIPSIDLMDGQSVQLVGGKAESRSQEREYGDPVPLLRKFSIAGEVAVIDLDRALGKGSNEDVIRRLVKQAPCRVGGGIRSLEAAVAWLDAGAAKIILGTAAKPEILRELPAGRVIAALDAFNNDVVVEGWTKSTGVTIMDRLRELREDVGGFLVTFVEREGRLGGTNMELAREIVAAAGKARVTFAGGITTAEEIAELDKLGADSQVGMAIYTGRLDFGDAISAPLVSDRPDGLFPTIVADESGVVLGMAYSSRESIRAAVARQLGIYQSRKRGLWVKGETSGATQELFGIALDCDRDALRFIVRQNGSGYCHLDQFTCFGDMKGLARLQQTTQERRENAPSGSYTKRLFDDAALLRSKLVEEAGELADAATAEDVAWEAADLLYFAFVAMAKAGVSIADVERQLDLRALKLTRRPGNAKAP